MTTNLDTFCLFIENWIGDNINGNFTVTVKWNGIVYGNLKVNKKKAKPLKFT